MFKLLDRYLLKRFLINLGIAVLTWILIFLIVDIIENISRFIDKKATLEQFSLYYLYYIPYIISLTLPVAMLLSTLFTVSNFAQNNEIVAQLSAGVSLYRILLPLLLAAFALSIAAGFFNELVVPETNQRRLDIMRYDVQHKIRPSQKSRSNIYVQDSAERTFSVGYFNGRDKRGRNISIKTYHGSTLVERMDAESMVWKEGSWLLKKVKLRRFNGKNESLTILKDTLITNSRIEPAELLLIQKKPEEMSYSELNQFIDNLQEIGADIKKWLVERYLKLSLPFANFIVVLLGAPLASRKRRGGMGFNFGFSLLISFVYFFIIRAGQVFGHQGSLPPLLAAWLGNLIFLAIGLYALLAVRK